jgi:hypothetical protein
MPTTLIYVADRYDELARSVNTWGFAVDERSARSGWSEAKGTISITAYAVSGGTAVASNVSFTATEYWTTTGTAAGLYNQQGCTIVGYSYHGQVGNQALRYCYLPDTHPPGYASHIHRPGEQNMQVYSWVKPDYAIAQVYAFYARRLVAGFVPQLEPIETVIRSATLAPGVGGARPPQ